MGRVDLISLMFLVSSILLLAGMALAIPPEQIDFTSICRSRADDVAAKVGAVPTMPVATRVKAKPQS